MEEVDLETEGLVVVVTLVIVYVEVGAVVVVVVSVSVSLYHGKAATEPTRAAARRAHEARMSKAGRGWFADADG